MMNRIRKVAQNQFEVLITPDIKFSPDSALMIGNWTDRDFRGFYIMTFESMNDALGESLKHPDIDWHRIANNHVYIFDRLKQQIKSVVDEYGNAVDFKAVLLTGDELKQKMFERVNNGGNKFNLGRDVADIISFTIIHPSSAVLMKLMRMLEAWNVNGRDDLRIKRMFRVDQKIIVMQGVTEAGTSYEIRLVPSMLHAWTQWYLTNFNQSSTTIRQTLMKFLKQQSILDTVI